MGGGVQIYPRQKKGGGGGGGRTSFSNAEGGCTKSLEVVLTWELEVLVILKGMQRVSTLQKGGAKSFTLS